MVTYHAFRSKSEMAWYFISVYVTNRTSHGRLEKQNWSSCVEKYFVSPHSHAISPIVTSTNESHFAVYLSCR